MNSQRIGPPQRERCKIVRMPILIYIIGMAIEWGMAGLARGGLYW